MATLNQIADGIEARLATISGLRGSSEFKETVNPPAAIALVTDVRPSTFDTRHEATFRVLVVVTLAGGMGKASRALKPYMSPSGAPSIFAALEGDATLGGVAESVLLGEAHWSSEGIWEWGTVAYWGAALENVTVLFTDT